jgi:hypothetical protein
MGPANTIAGWPRACFLEPGHAPSPSESDPGRGCGRRGHRRCVIAGPGRGSAGHRAGDRGAGLWLRGGFLYQNAQVCGTTDPARSFDAGLAYRKRWAGGSLFAAEGGVETVSRASGIVCNDGVLGGNSDGFRVSVGGQYALTRGLGLYGRIGARTGQHVLEIGALRELWIGVAFEL